MGKVKARETGRGRTRSMRGRARKEEREREEEKGRAGARGSVKPGHAKNVRMPGVEPGSQAWEACMMPLHYMRHAVYGTSLALADPPGPVIPAGRAGLAPWPSPGGGWGRGLEML